MKKLKFTVLLTVSLLAMGLSSCEILQQSVEPRNPDEKNFDIKNFDKLEMGNAFHVTVKHGSDFKVEAKGESRDINDLIVRKENGELKIYYSKWRLRRYRMEIEIEMPTLKEVDFSGASTATIDGFNNLDELEVDLSGASRATLFTKAQVYKVDLSGASELSIQGSGQEIIADLSGASVLNAFDAPVKKATFEISGASTGRVNVLEKLSVRASGASKVEYRGNPEVKASTSGSSKVEKD
ncbi:head GIN domain-containing protein [Emticicia sp. 17c]|uniref:head GIN domain-containing protein n=1 Tax=Emticicia sp. 17c TaxID=3127704 RepID=UPI00301C6CA6